jgi:hypothetical protein
LRRRIIAISALVLVVVGGLAAYELLPRGALEGSVAEPLRDWSSTNDVTTIQLETRPSDPYSVSIWSVGLGPNLYIHAGANRSRWVENIEANADVRVRIEEKIYELRAFQVTDEVEFEAFADAWERKYDMRPRNENVAEVYAFRLVNRGAKSAQP